MPTTILRGENKKKSCPKRTPNIMKIQTQAIIRKCPSPAIREEDAGEYPTEGSYFWSMKSS